MKKVLAFVVVMMLMTSLHACEPSAEPEEVPTPTPKPETSIEAPEDVIPLTVPGFELIEKDEYVPGFWHGAVWRHYIEYSAYSVFKPEPYSRFYDKVTKVEIHVELCKDLESANYVFERHGMEELYVDGTRSVWEYGEVTGIGQFYEVRIYQQYGLLVIMSYALSTPSKTKLPNPTFDKEAVKEAAIEGLKAVRL